MGDGTKENPFTREDVRKRIRQNGDTAKGLDFSGKEFEEEVDLCDLNLKGIILNNAGLFRAKFNGSNLAEAKLRGANLLQAKFNPMGDYELNKFANLRDADLSGADLSEAEFIGAFLDYARFDNAILEQADFTIIGRREPDLLYTDFRDADLRFSDFTGRSFFFTKLEGAFLNWAKITEGTFLGDADWGSYKIGEETKYKNYYTAEKLYRHLKVWYTNAGIYDVAGEFFFREMTAQRKRIEWWPRLAQRKGINWWLHPRHRLWSGLHSFVSGYGESVPRVVRFGALVLFGLALLYFFLHGVAPYNLSVQAFLNSLYYSAVSFTALGYGPWFTAASVRSWVQGTGAAEAFIGVFTIALFLITFTRKMRR